MYKRTLCCLFALGVLLAASRAGAWEQCRVVWPERGVPVRRFALQAARFADEGRAFDLCEQLRAKGYTPYVFATSRSRGGQWFAVRFGLQETFQKARDKAGEYKKETGRAVQLTISGLTDPLDLNTASFIVQAGAFQKKENAEKRMRELGGHGFPAHLVPMRDDAGVVWQVVYTQRFTTYEPAVRAARAFKKKMKLPCYVVITPNELLHAEEKF